MINYNSKNWMEGISHFRSSYIIRKTLRSVLVVGAYTALVILIIDFLPFEVKIDAVVFSLLGIFLSLLMSFRNSTAYDRYWEGRKQWGALINHTRGLAVIINGVFSQNEVQKAFYARSISAYVHALSEHLRDKEAHEVIKTYSDIPEEKLMAIRHVPNKIVNDMYARAESLFRDGFIEPAHLRNIKEETQSFLDIQGACERIKATPIPFSYNFFIKLFISVYVVAMPFVLAPAVMYYAIPVTMFVAYALIGLEYISVEIEEPFGLDCNDLPTLQLANKIEGNVHEILEVELTHPIKRQPAENYMVIN